MLRELYADVSNGKIDVSEIARRIGRSVTAIHVRASQLGIKFAFARIRYRKPTKYSSETERREARATVMRERHKRNGHPMLGRHHTEESKKKISERGIGRKRTSMSIASMLATKLAKYGTTSPRLPRGSWKASWREIGGKKIFARSIWEANYARFLEFLKVRGEIAEWEHEPKVFWFNKIKRGCRSFLPDFRVTQLNGTREYHEVKGWMDKRSATKIRRFFKYYPNEILILRDKTWFSLNNAKMRGLIPDWEHSRGLPITSNGLK